MTARVAASALALTLLVGCAPSPPEVRAPVSASTYRSRDDDAVGGQLQVTLTGASEQPVTVRSVALRSPGFETVDATPREITLDRGSRIDVTVPYGTALCDVGAEPATAVVETSDDIAVEVPLASQNDTLNRIHAEECAAAELADIVAVTLVPGPPPADPAAPLSAVLTLDRRGGDDPLRLDEIRGSLLYALSSEEVPVTLASGTASIDVPVTLSTASCEPHVIADARKPFVFPAWIAVGDGVPVYTRIPVPVSVQRQLVEYQQRACAR
ncbi:hypothetical protein HQ305_09990 [Rhodococcus sp. BP-149]|uniref:hypothetical protein n=1 Tax=unclassified Rhodococcus (in: high G+C Gram-positive bacteria) TaxID=192944 RepID=UPI001C9A8956|nr:MULTISPECIES: hypothetical protein [unclassified Rhodococcus (in: high G+C Gram-positive bacteria)]MBY6686411.1 hypothetical protein [Rhodococcus sp. BP-288]MBY6693500.1 hypothetical protein [Rhodococcus sp. BP-188]MBY6699903.1 hypothetical protein [Rhodococcus sp. BP-285]MBY6703752.1 hypothetical protein [Rhodococcus sp. BP-283]MBY6711100.1 hypothetical protein [Rhodococcus sp. BP-160]